MLNWGEILIIKQPQIQRGLSIKNIARPLPSGLDALNEEIDSKSIKTVRHAGRMKSSYLLVFHLRIGYKCL